MATTETTVTKEAKIATYTTVQATDFENHTLAKQSVQAVAVSDQLLVDATTWEPDAGRNTLDVKVSFSGRHNVEVAEAAASWLSVCGVESATFGLVVSENTGAVERTGTVTVTPVSGDDVFIAANTRTITVKQAVKTDKAIEPSPTISIPAAGGLVTVKIKTKGRWNANCLSDWTVLKKDGEFCYSGISNPATGKDEFQIEAKPNTTGAARECRLLVRCNDGLDMYAKVEQEANI